MPLVHNLCSHIQNASKSGLKRIAIPFSKTNKQIATILYQEGLVQQVQDGSVHGPLIDSIISQKRIWIDLKYRHGQPVLTSMGCISKPSRRVFCSPEEARLICAQASKNALLKNQTLGQVTILNTPYGIVEIKTALQKGVGGEVLCYAK
jgi:small subunit ribosomal protein S8